VCPFSIKDEIVWFSGMAQHLRLEKPASLQRWRVISIRPAIPSMSSEEEVLKALVIHSAAQRWSLFNLSIWYFIGAPLKYHSWNPYNAMGRMHVQ